MELKLYFENWIIISLTIHWLTSIAIFWFLNECKHFFKEQFLSVFVVIRYKFLLFVEHLAYILWNDSWVPRCGKITQFKKSFYTYDMFIKHEVLHFNLTFWMQYEYLLIYHIWEKLKNKSSKLKSDYFGLSSHLSSMAT
jgi:hypothetical protein